MRKGCNGCVHYRQICHDEHDKCCHYMLDTGEKRESQPGAKCNKKKVGKFNPYTQIHFWE